MKRGRGSLGAAWVALALLLAGCGLTDLHLDLGYPEAAARRGPLGELAPISFELSAFGDERPDADRVGNQKNGLGTNVSAVRANPPVPGLFRDAVAAQLRANGHRVDTQARFGIEAVVTQFWVDLQPGLSYTAVGTASCALRVVDRPAGAVIYAQRYTGQYTHENSSMFKSSYERPLSLALQRMAWEIAIDPALVAALREALRRGSGPSTSDAE